MRRHSIKKASTFKLQGQRNKFQSYLQDIENCPMIQKHPQMIEMIKQTSETVFGYCYTFRQDSPFNKGLNYGSKSIGFSFHDNVLHYKEWLPNIDAAYIMGEFNQFNTESHKLERSEEDGQGWFRIQVDLNGSHLQDQGSKVMLRIVDHQGTQSYMIPPSCHIIAGGYGIVKKAEILPISKKKLKYFFTQSRRINELLAYTIDLNKMSLTQCLELLSNEEEICESYNTIILKNFFKNNYGLMYRYSVQFEDLEKLREIVLRIKNECGCKAVIEWNFQRGKTQYMSNPVQERFLKQINEGSYGFDFSDHEVMAYYLANASYFYQNFGIDGIHFTNIEHALQTKEGIIVLKCLNVLNNRIIDSGITLGSSKDNVEALTGEIVEGGCGFNFTYNYHQSLVLKDKHQDLFAIVQKISDQSNCLAIDFDDFDSSHILNLIFAILVSKKGIFTKGDFSSIKPCLRKILKLRCQDKLFDNEISGIKFTQNDNVIAIERGVSKILFNFGEEQEWVDVSNCAQKEVIFTHNADVAEVNENRMKLPAKSCLLMENEEQSN